LKKEELSIYVDLYVCLNGVLRMGQLNITLPDDLEERVRKTAVKKFGAKKGFLSKAFVEALEEWLKKNEK